MYSKPGPPYTDDNVQSIRVPATEAIKVDAAPKQQNDSDTQSSNIEKKTNNIDLNDKVGDIQQSDSNRDPTTQAPLKKYCESKLAGERTTESFTNALNEISYESGVNHHSNKKQMPLSESEQTTESIKTSDRVNLGGDRTKSKEQAKLLKEKLNSHIENLEKFKQMAGKKLRDAIERSSGSSIEDEAEEMRRILNYSPAFQEKRHSSNNDYLNSVW